MLKFVSRLLQPTCCRLATPLVLNRSVMSPFSTLNSFTNYNNSILNLNKMTTMVMSNLQSGRPFATKQHHHQTKHQQHAQQPQHKHQAANVASKKSSEEGTVVFSNEERGSFFKVIGTLSGVQFSYWCWYWSYTRTRPLTPEQLDISFFSDQNWVFVGMGASVLMFFLFRTFASRYLAKVVVHDNGALDLSTYTVFGGIKTFRSSIFEIVGTMPVTEKQYLPIKFSDRSMFFILDQDKGTILDKEAFKAMFQGVRK